MKIYIGNISQQVNEQDLENLFNEYGQVSYTKIVRDLFSNESKGFAFIEMNDKAAADKAIEANNFKELKGKKIVVNEARPKTDSKQKGGRRSW